MLNSLLLLTALAAANPELVTVYEQSNFTKTGRYDEVIRLCSAYEKTYAGRVKCEQFGTTPEGRPMLAMIISGDGLFTLAENKKKFRAVMMFQGGIHSGEIDGKDAGFLFIRDVLDGKVLPDVLRRVTFVFVPVFNIDGHERFGPNNRPNQRGPESMGWRTTAENLNLNRDYAKADAPEMHAMLKLLRAWDPILYLDLHVTDGAKFEHDVAVMIEPTHLGPDVIRRPGIALRDRVMKALTKARHLPLPFYPAFEKEDDPKSGFGHGVPPPRFSQAYWAARNRFGVLVETHSWRPYAHRVKTTYDVLVAFAEAAKTDGLNWTRAGEAADALDARRGGSEVVLAYDTTQKARTIAFRGYAYTQERSDISGQTVIRYDEKKPQVWKVPLYEELKPVTTAVVPKAGWVVPVAFAPRVKEKLDVHGFRSETISADQNDVAVSAYRATEPKFSGEPFEGRQMVSFKSGSWKDEKHSFPKGSLFIPSDQPGITLLTHLMDPAGRDSLAAWGFFNVAFEQKEYMEDYVAEEEARKMIAADPALKAEFDKKLAEDPDFAKSPKARLRFFYQRHPAFDARLNLLPVFKVAAPLSPN